MSEFKEKMASLIKSYAPVQYSLKGKVSSVNEDEGTASVKFKETPLIKKAHLAAEGADCILVPKVGSKVIVIFVDNKYEQAYISSISKIDKILLIIDSTKFKITVSDSDIEFETAEGSFKLLEYCGQINKILQAINTWGQTVTPPLTLLPPLLPPTFP
ncbi:MAG: hypothetical protein JXB24_06340 [Bacteroidales bacterium]|nr:hypothetical protein [Bacteroidales bacterium]